MCLTELTGVAVSPLLVFSGLGAYQYFASPTQPDVPRPLHTQPLVWGAFLLILCITWISSISGLVLPSPIKSVVDSLQYLQEHVTGLLAAGMLMVRCTVS
ncbi:MAG: hypothetical protein FGM37_11585 [Phycisphaerales bacterium]|nr:hypothetical protein [Phycisphaerales bacterium]